MPTAMTHWMVLWVHSRVRPGRGVWLFQLVSDPSHDKTHMLTSSDHCWRIVKLGTGTSRSSEQAQSWKWFRPVYRCVSSLHSSRASVADGFQRAGDLACSQGEDRRVDSDCSGRRCRDIARRSEPYGGGLCGRQLGGTNCHPRYTRHDCLQVSTPRLHLPSRLSLTLSRTEIFGPVLFITHVSATPPCRLFARY